MQRENMKICFFLTELFLSIFRQPGVEILPRWKRSLKLMWKEKAREKNFTEAVFWYNRVLKRGKPSMEDPTKMLDRRDRRFRLRSKITFCGTWMPRNGRMKG